MRGAAIIVLITWLVRACGASTPPVPISAPSRIVPPSPTSLRFSTAANRAAAKQNVRKLIRIVVLPHGARQVAALPKSASRRFRDDWGLPTRQPETVSIYRVWLVREPLKQVVRYVQAHARPRPRPEVPFRSKTYGVAFHANGSYEFPPIPGRSWSRWLNVGMTALPSGSTVVVARAGEEWIHTPPRSAEIPAGTKRIDVVSRIGKARPNVLVHVRNRVDVGSIVALLNGLGTVPPKIACFGDFFGGPTVTLRLRGADGRILARASVSASVGFPYSGPCNPLELAVGDRPAVPLVGADILRRIQRLLDIELAPPVPRDVAACLQRHGWHASASPRLVVARSAGTTWRIRFPLDGKVTTGRPPSRALAHCVKTGHPPHVIYG